MLESITARELQQLHLYGAARARADQRAWWLVVETTSGRYSLTPDPGRSSQWAIVRVYRPSARCIANLAPVS